MEVRKHKVYLENKCFSFGYQEQKMQLLKLSVLPLCFLSGGEEAKFDQEAIEWMKSQGRRRLSEAVVKGLTVGKIMVWPWSYGLHTELWLSGHWEMTVPNKWRRQNCKDVKVDFGNLLSRSLILPLLPRNSPGGALEASRQGRQVSLLGKVRSIFPPLRAPSSLCHYHH